MVKTLTAQGLEGREGTIKFITIIDRVFDCLNVASYGQDKKGKPELAPYESVNDWRFEVPFSYSFSFEVILIAFISEDISLCSEQLFNLSTFLIYRNEIS